MRKDFESFINVINNVIFNKKIETADINFDAVRSLAKSHSMSAVVFEFIKKRFGTDSAEYAACEKQSDLLDYGHIIRKKEFEALSAQLDKSQIRYMPFKGILLMELYPNASLREMSDIDILVDRESLGAVKELLTARGYSFEHKGHHDVYRKEPGICFEIHEVMVDKQRDTGLDEFFKDPWSLAEADGNKYRLTAENEYIYLMTHLYGHFHQGGIGVRTVLDVYLYAKAHKLDFDYIDKAFEEYGLTRFAGNITALSEAWFSEGRSEPLLDELGEYIMTSGTYGRISRLNKDLSRTDISKTKNICNTLKRKLFLSKKEINTRYPWSEHTLLLPAAYIGRLLDVIINHRKEAGTWLNELASANGAELKAHKERMRRFGVRA